MICTFYSYKGGVGRSMALANVADVMAREGLNVLMIDFDLEAPGLEKFFPVNHRHVQSRDGLLDLLLSYKHAMSQQTADEAAQRRFRNVPDFITPIYAEPLPSGGQLCLMTAGRRGHQTNPQDDEAQLSRYAVSIRTLDWQDFYINWAGEAFFEWLRRELTGQFDVVLVDSRTGVTEMGGICAYQLADAMVLFCATNQQNLEGTRNVATNLGSARVHELRNGRPLPFIVVPARVEINDENLREAYRARFEEAFAPYTPGALHQAGVDYWSLLIPYEARYAFEERIVVDPAVTDEHRRVAPAFEKLAGAIARLAPPESKLFTLWQRRTGPRAAGPAVQPLYDPTRQFARFDALLSYGGEDEPLASALAQGLRTVGLRIELDRWPEAPSEAWHASFEGKLFLSRTCLVLLGQSGIGPWRDQALTDAVTARVVAGELVPIPIAAPGGPPVGDGLPAGLRRHAPIELRAGADADAAAVAALVTMIRGETGPKATVTAEARIPYPGLRPFSEHDTSLFFGRDEVVKTVVKGIAESRFLVVAGPSGCGKTSLVQAGLFPALRGDAVSGSKHWLLRTMRPGATPFANLAGVLSPERPAAALTEAAATLAADPRVLLDRARAMVSSASHGEDVASARLLLFVDQFEKLFMQCEDEATRARFVDLVVGAASASDGPLQVVIGLRSDYNGDCLRHPGLAALLASRLVTVPPLTPDQLLEAIEKPAQRVGLAFEPGLVERIHTSVRDEPGLLPQLAEFLRLLTNHQRDGRLTHDGYDALGGVIGVLTKCAEETFSQLPEAQQVAARGIFLRLARGDQRRLSDVRTELQLTAAS